MYRAVIAVIDASRARFFTFDREAGGGGIEERMVEHTDLVNLARRMRPSELFSETRPPSNKRGTIDDHRSDNLDNMDAAFARTALSALRQLIDEHAPRRAIVCAAPRMLGALRAAATNLIPDDLEVDMLARDLVKLSPTELRSLLAAHGLLPGGAALHAAR
ncbi:MAG: host attachment protein [Deltaproteobacteria bacterium]|nr:host attachment protein [Deltaproteobacteria bacterium]MCW5802221.1 host attachment protein [Deltaproteobacteria bacterium]